MTSSLVLHHLENSRSQRILWLLEELQVPYEMKTYKRTADKRAPKELLEVNPLGKSPVITDGGVTLAESGAIVEYLINKYGKGRFTASEQGYVDNLYWTHFAEGSLQPLLFMRIVFEIIPTKLPFFLRPLIRGVFAGVNKGLLTPELTSFATVIEAHLEKSGTWFAGGDEPTSADFMMSFTLEVFADRASDILKPKMKEYVAHVQERPAYKRALEKGGEYAFVLKN